MELDFAAAPVRYFVAVAEEGGIDRAAESLLVVRPEALAQAISELEAEIGLELLEHRADGVTLTPVGEAFLAKARVAIAAYDEAALTARKLGRAARGQLQVGFVGPPPPVLAPDLFGAFAEAHADAELSFSDLQFPRDSTASWLSGVDVALCFSPSAHPDVYLQTVREDPRVVIATRGHPIASRNELTVAEVIDETFVGFDPAIERGWVSLLTLDDHRGAQPSRVTDERATNALEMLTIVATGKAIVVLAASHGEIIRGALPNLAVIPLLDAHPTKLTLAWRTDTQHPLVDAIVGLAGAHA
jgi:DNA-binding transcriptional LysR family regulator